MATISEADALAAHKAIHNGKDEAVKFPKFQAMEQNTSKSSAWAKKAKEFSLRGRLASAKKRPEGTAKAKASAREAKAKAKSSAESLAYLMSLLAWA
eukprot:Skav234603  [mRNA]  locus=scaffold5214:310218:313470:- [translate_table: standard]